MSPGVAAVLILAASLPSCAAAPGPAAAPTVIPPATPLIEWNAATGSIRCRTTTIEVPAPLRSQVRQTTPDEVSLVPAWSPPGGALVVTSLAANERADWAAFFGSFPATLVRLHRLAGGGDLGSGKEDATVTLKGGQIVAEYTGTPGSRRRAKLVYLQNGRCRIAALDLVDSSTLTVLLEGLEGDPVFVRTPGEKD